MWTFYRGCQLSWYYGRIYLKNQRTSSDVLQLANTNMPSNLCTKKTKAMQRRKCKSSKTSQEIMFYNEDEVQTTTKQNNTSSKDQPFHVTKCYGCGREYNEKFRQPPNDIILKRFDHRVYTSPKSKVKKRTANLQNTYFHLNIECVRRICPTYELKDILIHDESLKQLTTE